MNVRWRRVPYLYVRPHMPSHTSQSAQHAILQIANAADRRLAWEFFVLFSRFEYALKRSGFLRPNVPEAQADWGRFARENQPAFSERNSASVAEAVAYYNAEPPRKQLQQNGRLHWSNPLRPVDGERPLEFLCRAIGTVRNNLFHGGKFPQFPVHDASRDEALLKYAKELLFELLELDAEVRRQFFEGIEE